MPQGYQGAYDSVQRHARAWRRARSQHGAVFIPLWFAPGEAYQFDWSHEVVVLGGVTTTVKPDLDSRTGFRHREWQKCWRLIKPGQKCGAKL